MVYKNLNISTSKIEDKKISIIIPTHNRFELLSELLVSIFRQTYQNFEIILIDDVSTDKTYEVYAKYHDRRLKYFRNHENLGAGLNRQKGYNLSHGDYVIFCDDDDYFIDNNYFHDLINIFKDESINVVCSESYSHFEQEGRYQYSGINIDVEIIDSIEYLKNFMIKYAKPRTISVAFRRKALIKAKFKEMTMMNDTPMQLRALVAGGNVFINKKIIGVYRFHGNNVTFNLKSDFIIKNLEEKLKIYEYLKVHNAFSNIDEWYAKQIGITVNYFLKHNSDEKAADDVINWLMKMSHMMST